MSSSLLSIGPIERWTHSLRRESPSENAALNLLPEELPQTLWTLLFCLPWLRPWDSPSEGKLGSEEQILSFTLV